MKSATGSMRTSTFGYLHSTRPLSRLSSVSAVDERFCDLGDVTLCYETFGDPAQPTVLLIMGLGTQMVAWHEDFCGRLADRGFHVIRFDNRDVGRSTSFDHAKPPTRGEIIRRRPRVPAYTLSDMAGDAAGLLDHLDVDAAHVVGASMGGMIAQTLAAEHPDRVLSLVSIMSNTGSLWNGQPALRLYPFLLRQPPREKEAYLDAMVLLFGAIGSLRLRARRGGAAPPRRAELRTGDQPPRHRAPARGDPRDRRSHPGVAPDQGTHAGDPRQGRPAGAALGRKGHGQGDQGRAPRPGRGHGPRPAAAGVGHGSSTGSPRTRRGRRSVRPRAPPPRWRFARARSGRCSASCSGLPGRRCSAPGRGPTGCWAGSLGDISRGGSPAPRRTCMDAAVARICSRGSPTWTSRSSSRRIPARRHGAGAAAMAARPLLDGPRGSAAGPPVGLRRRRAA